MTALQIVGNVLTGIGMSLFFISSLVKTKKRILILQTGNHFFCAIAEFFCMEQYPGGAQDIVSIVRNIILTKDKNNKFFTIFFIVLALVLGITFNICFSGNDPWGYLPVFASFQYSIVILLPKIEVPFIKASMGVSCICWTIYGFVYGNYVQAAFNIAILISAMVSIIKYYMDKHKDKEVEAHD